MCFLGVGAIHLSSLNSNRNKNNVNTTSIT